MRVSSSGLWADEAQCWGLVILVALGAGYSACGLRQSCPTPQRGMRRTPDGSCQRTVQAKQALTRAAQGASPREQKLIIDPLNKFLRLNKREKSQYQGRISSRLSLKGRSDDGSAYLAMDCTHLGGCNTATERIAHRELLASE